MSPSWKKLFGVTALILSVVSHTIPSAALAAATPVKQVINIGNGGEPKDLDPHITTGVPEHHIQENLFEGLVMLKPKTLEPVPGVCEKWTISKDAKTYTFKIRKEAKWSNGEPLTAQDFVYSLTRLVTPATASEYVAMGYLIKNGKAFYEGKVKADQFGVKALDPQTLEITLENPTPYFLSVLYHHSFYPVPKAVIEKHGARWTRPENIVTNGPFKLSKWELNKVIQLVKNPNYWGKDKITLEEANFFPIDKLDTEEKMFRAGELHTTNEIPLEKIPFWQKDKTGVYQQHPFLGMYFYWINVNKPPFNKKEVRKAFALGFDRDVITKLVTRGGQLPATAFTPPGTGGFKPVAKLPADLKKLDEAKKLLAAAGYPEGKGLPPVEILYNTNDGHKKIAEALQQMWKKNLGVDVKLFNQEWKVYLDTQRTHNFNLSRAGWIGDYNDPNTFLDMFVSGSGLNHADYKNPEYDKLYNEAAKEMNVKKRLALFQKMEDIILEDLPVIPIYVYTRVFLKSPLVKNWEPNIQDFHMLRYVSMGSK